MKTFKKLMMLVISMVMMLAMGITVFAEGHTISVQDSDTHEYKVFQVLTGTLAQAGSKQLGDPAWGADAIDPEADIDAFIASLSGKTDVEVANLVAEQVNTAGDGRGIVKKGQPINNLATGYYVLVDVTTLAEYGTDPKKIDTKALNVVQVVNDINGLQIKWGTTEDKKTITADTLGKDSGENTFTPGKDNDDVSIGDTVKYNIAAKVPDNADQFKAGTFFFVITDKLSDGLTFTEGSIQVYDGETLLTAEKYTVKYKPNTSNNNTFEIGLKNAAAYKGHTINVKYAAVLNENAVIGDAGNPNTSTVQFSNDPNKEYEGSPEDTNNPGFPDSQQDVPTGETPESKTITYSTGIEILKVDENGEPLTGVTFELSGRSAKKVVTKTETFTVDDTNGTYYKLKNGTYTKTAPTSENTMIDAEAGATKGYVEDSEASGEGVITVGGKTYRPYRPADDAGKKIYVLKEGSKDAYADEHNARFDGLGEGTYTITETQTPSGYNTVSPVELTVTYNANGEEKFSASGATYEDGVLKIRVVNKKGTELPETGGIGTTLFYIIGAILVLGAGILLVTRRRMNAR